jgi:dimethylglycine dehydrogenase
MKTSARVVVIGGGVVGCSVLFHLTRLGWRDLMLVERGELTAGSTWHAAGGYHAINADPKVARLQAYTIALYREIQDLSGQDVGLHPTGGISLAATDARWEFLQSEAARHHVLGIRSRLIGPEEIGRLCPLIHVDDLRGGLFMEDEGHVDPYGVTHAFAKAARLQGAEIYRHTRVHALHQRADGTWRVDTDQGEIAAQHVVNAAGLWAREVGKMAGVALPVIPMEHHYLVTGALPSLEGRREEIPTVVDLDGEMYLRQEQDGVLLGVYETPATPWAVDGTPWDYGGTDLLTPDLDRLQPALVKGFRRFPEVEQAGIKRIVNGPFTFTPDGNPLVGPVADAENYWCACGVMAGFAQGGGVGLALAQWMVHGEPEGDVFAMDVARFGRYADPAYTRDKAAEFYERRFRLAFPNERWPAARCARISPLYETLKARRAVFGVTDGLEYPLYFARAGDSTEETPTFYRSNAFEAVAQECQAVRAAAAVLEISAYGKYLVEGPGAATWLDGLLASRLPRPGRARIAVMLSPRGRVVGDLTVLRIDPERFLLVGAGAMQRVHLRWLRKNVPGRDVTVDNVSDRLSGFVIAGPRAREILQGLFGADLCNERMPFLCVQERDLDGVRAILARIGFTGELGFELYFPAAALVAVHRRLFEAAAHAGVALRNMGVYALNSLRLEKGYGIWFRELSPDYAPAMCGLDRFIAYDKDAFIGREAAVAGRNTPPARRLVTLEVHSRDFDLWGYDPVWSDRHLVGFTTSGGFGHRTGKSLAKAYLDTRFAAGEAKLEVETLGRRIPVTVLEEAPYDPEGRRLRM